MKKCFIIVAIVLALLCAVAFAIFFHYWQQPSVKYLLTMGGYLPVYGISITEERITVNNKTVPLDIYRKKNAHSNTYFVLFHGLTPQAHKHPQLVQMAKSIAFATGMNVIVPKIPEYFIKDATLHDVKQGIRSLYSSIVNAYPGHYRAFGACLSGTVMLSAFTMLPQNIYPEKILLFGPMFQGNTIKGTLFEKYFDVDFLVKLTISSNMSMFNPEEKDLIHKAMMSANMGITDETRMKQILGDRLFRDISIVTIDEEYLKKTGARTLLKNYKAIPNCKYFILHSKTDRIIPFDEGKSLFNFLKGSGTFSEFLGTELLDHVSGRITVKGFVSELKYMKHFFDELFEGDSY